MNVDRSAWMMDEWMPVAVLECGVESVRQTLAGYLTGVSGAFCTLPFQRIGELARHDLPEAAASEAWWTDDGGWHDHPASHICRSAGWAVESVHGSARLVRFVRNKDDDRGA